MRYFPKQIYAIDICYKLVKNARKNLYSIVSKDKKYQEIVSKDKNYDEDISQDKTKHQKVNSKNNQSE